ncbi:trypsin-like serine peptidase [Geodermatophilus nigrescens]
MATSPDTGTATLQQNEDDVGGMPMKTTVGAATKTAAQAQTATVTVPAESFVIEEVGGQVMAAPSGGESAAEAEAEAHAEAVGEATESGDGESAEATAEQLAEAAIDAENAYSDLRAVEGFEEASVEAGAEGGMEALPDAGEAVGEGSQEFLPVLASLAASVVPTLVSKIGPRVARGVLQKLTPRTRKALKRQRAGGGILSVLAGLLESAEQQPLESVTESESESIEAIVAEAVQALEVVIGTDERVRITKTTNVPWRRICALRITMAGNRTYRGTGFFIGPRTVATAGHCVFLKDQGGWAKKIEVIPGANGALRPFGSAVSTSFRSTQGWIRDGKADSDYGCVVLPPDAFPGQRFGSFGFGVFPPNVLLAKRAVLAGYPGDKPFAELWGMPFQIKTVEPQRLVYTADTAGGQSGSGVYVKINGKRYVVGIHNYGATSGNSATRVTEPVFRNLQAWSRL